MDDPSESTIPSSFREDLFLFDSQCSGECFFEVGDISVIDEQDKKIRINLLQSIDGLESKFCSEENIHKSDKYEFNLEEENDPSYCLFTTNDFDHEHSYDDDHFEKKLGYSDEVQISLRDIQTDEVHQSYKRSFKLDYSSSFGSSFTSSTNTSSSRNREDFKEDEEIETSYLNILAKQSIDEFKKGNNLEIDSLDRYSVLKMEIDNLKTSSNIEKTVLEKQATELKLKQFFSIQPGLVKHIDLKPQFGTTIYVDSKIGSCLSAGKVFTFGDELQFRVNRVNSSFHSDDEMDVLLTHFLYDSLEGSEDYVWQSVFWGLSDETYALIEEVRRCCRFDSQYKNNSCPEFEIQFTKHLLFKKIKQACRFKNSKILDHSQPFVILQIKASKILDNWYTVVVFAEANEKLDHSVRSNQDWETSIDVKTLFNKDQLNSSQRNNNVNAIIQYKDCSWKIISTSDIREEGAWQKAGPLTLKNGDIVFTNRTMKEYQVQLNRS